jgi:hypothetical protein
MNDSWVERAVTVFCGPHVNNFNVACNSETVYVENIGHTPPVCVFIGSDAELRRAKPDLYRALQVALR